MMAAYVPHSRFSLADLARRRAGGRGDSAQGEDYGTLNLAKIKNEISIMEDLGLIKPGQVTVEKAATLEYLPPPEKQK